MESLMKMETLLSTTYLMMIEGNIPIQMISYIAVCTIFSSSGKSLRWFNAINIFECGHNPFEWGHTVKRNERLIWPRPFLFPHHLPRAMQLIASRLLGSTDFSKKPPNQRPRLRPLSCRSTLISEIPFKCNPTVRCKTTVRSPSCRPFRNGSRKLITE